MRLIDTGALANVDRIDRGGFEGLWIDGPWSVQGEYLREQIARKSGARDFNGEGWYVFGSWVPTGESRPYTNGNTGNIKPRGEWGAVELLLRYSTLDLNDAAVHGGRQHDWTLGANWYLTTHFKFQANYVRAYSEKGTLSLDPRIFEVRAQIMF